MANKLLREAFFKNLIKSKTSDTSSEEVAFESEDPIEVYNHTIKQFNAKCNKATEGIYETISNNWLYRQWMLRWWTRIRADSNCCFLFLSFCVSFVIGLIPILNYVDISVWIIVYFIYEKKRRIHNVNVKLAPNPFKFMIYSPEVCKQAGLMNAYYELPVSALGDVGLKSGQIETLKLKAKNGTVVFMVYNSNFRRNYTNFGYLRWYHVSHLLIIAAGIVFANFWLYDQLGISSII